MVLAMNLWIHKDASYITGTKARSQVGGYHYISKKPKLHIKSDNPPSKHNHPVIVLRKVVDAVMSSTQESKTGGSYNDSKEELTALQMEI